MPHEKAITAAPESLAKTFKRYRGKTKAFHHFVENSWRTQALLYSGLTGLSDHSEPGREVLRKLARVPNLTTPAPPGYEPTLSAERLVDGSVKMSMDPHTAYLIKCAIRIQVERQRRLRFHYYGILAVYSWASFEAYVVSLLEELYTLRPELLKSAEMVSFRDVIENRDRLLEHLVGIQLSKVGHFTLGDMLKYLKGRLSITVPVAQRARLNEFYFVRNVVAHGAGVVRKDQRKNLPAGITLRGDQVHMTKHYLDNMTQTIARVVMRIERNVDPKFFKASTQPAAT